MVPPDLMKILNSERERGRERERERETEHCVCVCVCVCECVSVCVCVCVCVCAIVRPSFYAAKSPVVLGGAPKALNDPREVKLRSFNTPMLRASPPKTKDDIAAQKLWLTGLTGLENLVHLVQSQSYKRKNRFYEMNGDVGMAGYEV